MRQRAARSSLQILLLGWFLVDLWVLAQALGINLSLMHVTVQVLVVFIAGLFTLRSAFDRGFWAPATLFLLVVGIFHVGLAPYILFGWDPAFPRADDYVWFYGEAGRRAFVLVSIFMSAFVTSALSVAVLKSERWHTPSVVDDGRELSGALARTGSLALILGIVFWFFVAYRAGGAGIFFGSYVSFLNATAGVGLHTSYMVIGVGLGLAVLDLRARSVRVALSLFALYAFIAFFLGLRGEVLFPVAVAASVLAYRRRMPRGSLVALTCVVGLSLISAVKHMRQVGLSAGLGHIAAFNPLEALAEMGSTLRVVAHVVVWHDFQGDPFLSGATYTVSVARLTESLFAPTGGLPATADFRLMNVEVLNRSGAIGGSVVAEAFHNFGVYGVAGVATVLGLVFAGFSGASPSVRMLAVYICVGLPLFNHVRNSFVPVIPFLVFSGLAVGAFYLLNRRGRTDANGSRQ